MGDLHVNAGRLRDGDCFADGLAAAVGLVANVRRVRGAVAAEHARERQDLGAVGMAARSGEESGGEPPGAGGQGLREQALHLGQLLGRDGPALASISRWAGREDCRSIATMRPVLTLMSQSRPGAPVPSIR